MKTMLSNLKAIAQNTQTDTIKMIDIDELHNSEENFFGIERIEEFAYTILGQGGVKDNLIVRPLESGGYEIISGHRRRAAVQYLLDHGEQISRLLPCLIQTYTDDDSKMLDLIMMNVSARQLTDQELWQCYEALDKILQKKKEAGEWIGRVRETLAEMLGVSPAQIGKLQNVAAHAIEPVREAVASGEISISTANEIAKLDEETQQELADGDLSEVKPKAVKKAAAKETPKVDTNINDTPLPEPVTVKWDGEIQLTVVKKQLMHLVSDKMRKAAMEMNGMDFTNAFRSENKHVGIGVETGVFTQCSFDRITISFSNPSKHDNIRKIEITWRMAAKHVQQWIQEHEKLVFSDDQAAKVDTNINEPANDDTDDQELEGQITFTEAAEKNEPEVDTSINDAPTGSFTEIAMGYLTLTLQAMGMNPETISDAQMIMNGILRTSSAEQARAAIAGFYKSEG